MVNGRRMKEERKKKKRDEEEIRSRKIEMDLTSCLIMQTGTWK